MEAQTCRKEMVMAEMLGDYGEKLLVMGGRAKFICGVGGLLLFRVKPPVRHILTISSIRVIINFEVIVR